MNPSEAQITIIRATSLPDIDAIRTLLRTYAESRGHDAALGDFEWEMKELPGKYGPPLGCLLLAKQEGVAAACVAFQPLEEGICEMKRMYVAPEFRGKGIARALCQALIEEAMAAGCTHMRLDTHPSMTAAQQLYQQLGFEEISRYNQNPTPGIRFFEKRLD
ncbi:MAG: GNAT family N-acetyltransferase [Bacteroidota bacterium]